MEALAVAPMIRADGIKPALRARGLTQRAVARRLGVHPVSVCQALAFAEPGGLLARIAETVFDTPIGPEAEAQTA
jgi:hypothetical protein